MKLLNVCDILRELDDSVRNLTLNQDDLNYFCKSVSINPKSPTFRKHICISKKSDLIRKYIECVPSSISTVYEICTLDSEKFEELVKFEQITSSTTLRELKELTGKLPVSKPSKSSDVNFLRIDFDFNSLSFDLKKQILKLHSEFKSNYQLRVFCTIPEKILNSSNNVIDIETTELRVEDEVLV